MKDDIKEIINYFKDDIEFLEKELKNPNFLGRYITIRDKECDYLKRLLDYITNLQEQLEVSQTNEETYRLEMQDITKILGLNEHTMFDEVKEYAIKLQEDNEMYAQLKDEYEDIIDKAIDKLYCYGEVFDRKILQQFQKEMLSVLQGEDNE